MILWLYAQPHDPLYPVVCLDERPCFLIGDVVEPLAMQTGQVRKEHYAYAKLGSCSLFAAIEPLTGNRLAQVHDRRTKREFALFCQHRVTWVLFDLCEKVILAKISGWKRSTFVICFWARIS